MATTKKATEKNGVVQRGKKWSYLLRVPDPITGKTKPLWVSGFDSAISAKLARDKARVALGNRDYVAPSKATVGDFLKTWIELHAKNIKPTTLNTYRKLLKNYLIPQLGIIKIQGLKASDIELFITNLITTPGKSGRPLNPATAVRCLAILKKCLKYAVEVEGLLTFNPASRVPMPKTNPVRPTPWSIAELTSFLDYAKGHQLSFYYRLSAFTGARRGELLALKWSDFNGSDITISKSRTLAGKAVVEQNTTKGGKNGQRRVALDPETIELFNAHRKRQLVERMALGELWQEASYIFVQESGLPLDTGTPTHLFTKVSNQAGLRPIRLHDLRHLHATELLRLGEPLHVVADRLGHRDPMVTATIYAHVSSQQAETASSRFANAVSGIS